MVKISRWDTSEFLDNDELIAGYLETAFEEDEGDGRLIRAALANIAKAQNMTKLADKCGISRKALYTALNENNTPRFDTVMKIIRGLDLTVNVGCKPSRKDVDSNAVT